MTELIYFLDCYAREFEAVVADAQRDRIVLDRTAFYPGGGGQPFDTGTISSDEGMAKVVDVFKRGPHVIHILQGAIPTNGKKVVGRIDWDKRYAHMRYHTAQHLLSSHFLERHNARTTGNQITARGASIDLEIEAFDPRMIEECEERINSWIRQSLPVKIRLMAREEALRSLNPRRTRIDLLPKSVSIIRIVEVEGIDEVACAGTHVKTTSELGTFRVVKASDRGKARRLEFALD